MRALMLSIGMVPGLLAAQDLLFDHLTTADGLPGNEVFTVHEDRHGSMWAGTRTGLARLEGTRVRVFHHEHDDSTSLAHDQVNDLHEDTSGRLWCATMAGLSRFDPITGGFINYRVRGKGNEAHQANRMIQVRCVGDSLVWVVSEGGLYRFHIPTHAFTRVNSATAGAGPPGERLARKALWPAADGQGLWCATDQGMASWDARMDRWTDHRDAPTGGACFTRAYCTSPLVMGDTLWWFEPQGYRLTACDVRTGEVVHYDSLDGTRNHFTLQWQDVDPDGRHWISTWTHRLLYREAGGTRWTEVLPSDSAAALRSSRVMASVLRRNGERWFATGRGIAILRPASRAMRLYPIKDIRGGVSRLMSWGDTLFVGTAGDGVVSLDLRTGAQRSAFFEPRQMPNGEVNRMNSIRHFAMRDATTCWVASVGGLMVLDLRQTRLTSDPASLDQLYPGTGIPNISFIEPDGDSALWIGTWNHGLWHVDLRSGATVTGKSGGPFGAVASDMMLCMFHDRKGRWWLGMNDGGGLARLENGRFSMEVDGSGANIGGVVRCITEAPDGRLWLGTHEEGIIVYDPEKRSTRYLTRRQGLPGVRVGAILFDRRGDVWACTDLGIAVRKSGADGFRALGLPVGLDPGRTADAAVELADGRLAFAVREHVIVIDPVLLSDGEAPPEARVTGYRVNGNAYLDSIPAGALVLGDGDKALSIELGVTGPYTASRPLFRYRRSVDAAWEELGMAQRLDLFDLPVGEHRIELQASANGVNWSRHTAGVDVRVLPMFYATWWFRGSLLVTIALLLFIGFGLYVQERLRAQRETFQREQAVLQERMRIAGDMHDDLGAGLSALKLRSEMALRVERDPDKREQLGSLARTAGELIGSMRQIIWTMNADQGSIDDLVSYTTHYARTYCEQNGLIPEVITIQRWPEVQLTSEQRRNIFLVAKEALHNVVKHAHARTVRLVFAWDDGLIVEVQDDGMGLPMHTQHSMGNGLRNMRKRIEALGGVLGTETGVGLPGDLKGAHIRCLVPVDANQRSIARAGQPQDLRRS